MLSFIKLKLKRTKRKKFIKRKYKIDRKKLKRIFTTVLLNKLKKYTVLLKEEYDTS